MGLHLHFHYVTTTIYIKTDTDYVFKKLSHYGDCVTSYRIWLRLLAQAGICIQTSLPGAVLDLHTLLSMVHLELFHSVQRGDAQSLTLIPLQFDIIFVQPRFNSHVAQHPFD